MPKEENRRHVNAGEEAFIVLNEEVEMFYRGNGGGPSAILSSSDILPAPVGKEHGAHPIREAQKLVIETDGV